MDLKTVMSSTPVLRLPNFEVPFVIETDASDFGVGAVLLQDNHPVAYFSKKLGPRRRISSTYHKELYAIVEAVQKWRQYLLGREFTIRSDQRSLRELLSQIVQTPDQQFYIRKLMGFKFTIEYKSGASNRVADALSRRDEDITDPGPALLALYARPTLLVMDIIKAENSSVKELSELHKAVAGGSAPPHVSVEEGLLYYKRRLFLGRDSSILRDILTEFHDTHTAGHSGVKRTLARLAGVFYWRGTCKVVETYVATCSVCQTTKYVTLKPAGLIQPLPIPDMVWSAASMDFIVGLPPSQGNTAVMVVVDCLAKYVHFGALKPGFDAHKVARLFVDTVVKLHGFPEKLLSDRDAIFMSDMWTGLRSLSGTKLQFTTVYHPQTDGQSEVTNRALEQYLRAFTFEQPQRWSQLLPWAELALNCSHNVSIGMSPFRDLYGRDPPSIFAMPHRLARNTVAAELLADRTETLRLLKENIARAQRAMTVSANHHRREVECQVGDKVLLRLQPYRQHSVGRPVSAKLGKRFYGPCEIIEKIGKVACRLQLPVDSKIHDVFHVSLLKPFIPPLSEEALKDLPSVFRRNHPLDVPVRASEARSVLVNGVLQDQWLVHWASDPSFQPSWEPLEDIRRHFPHLRLKDKSPVMGEGVDGGLDRDPDITAAQDDPEAATVRARSTEAGQPTRRNPTRARRKPARYVDEIPKK